jgi:hypothetical protein
MGAEQKAKGLGSHADANADQNEQEDGQILFEAHGSAEAW